MFGKIIKSHQTLCPRCWVANTNVFDSRYMLLLMYYFCSFTLPLSRALCVPRMRVCVVYNMYFTYKYAGDGYGSAKLYNFVYLIQLSAKVFQITFDVRLMVSQCVHQITQITFTLTIQCDGLNNFVTFNQLRRPI